MTPRPHRLSRRDFAALSHGGGGAGTMRALMAARRSRTLMLIRFVAGTAGDDVRVRRAYQSLSKLQQVAPDAVNQVLDHPSVGAWATRAAVRVRRGIPAHPADLAFVAAAAAVRAGVPTSVSLPPRAAISLPSLGTVLRPARGDIQVRCGDDGAELGGVRIPAEVHVDGPGWRGIPEITVDSDGLAASFLLDRWTAGELPPQIRVSGSPDLARWRDRIADGWDLLVRHHREVAEELSASVTVLTPLLASDTTVSSATLSDALGCVFLSLAPDARSIAVTLTHELQHTKLIALMNLLALLEPGLRGAYYAPWREDPRPLAGLLHGTYAYLGVTAFWRRQRAVETCAEDELDAHTAFARWRSATLGATETLLDSGGLTMAGQEFVRGMAGVLTLWCAEPVPTAAEAVADRLRADHRRRWLSAHGRGYRP